MTKKDMELRYEVDLRDARICLTKCPFGEPTNIKSLSCQLCKSYYGTKEDNNIIHCYRQGELKEQLNKNGGLK